ncbi:MAG: hypothetical protein ACLTQI_06020 [Slackia sp.]
MLEDDAIRAQGIASEEAGRALAGAGIVISELSVSHRDIEELFIGLRRRGQRRITEGERGFAQAQARCERGGRRLA